MSHMVVNRELCNLCQSCLDSCPFGGIEVHQSSIVFTAACRLCRACVKVCPTGAIAFEKSNAITPLPTETASYSGVLVYVEQRAGTIQPVSYEMMGKALELAHPLGQEVWCVVIGHGVRSSAQELLWYGIDGVYVYDHPSLEHFRIEPYTHAICQLADEIHPNVILVGATSLGRSLAPRVAARLRTGLTADCTTLQMRDNGELVQIRPAFGGNIMAQIITPHHRPQMATVRYKVMTPAQRKDTPHGKLVDKSLPTEALDSAISVLEVLNSARTASISEADVVVAAGRGIGNKRGLELVEQLADCLGGVVAGTRPLVERGWISPQQQVGLSGRTVRPKLYIACGISGAVQHIAGMKGSDIIIAINTDPHAPIFDVANFCIVGDVLEVLPKLIALIGGDSQHDTAAS